MKWMIALKNISVVKKKFDSCLNDFCRWLLLELNPPDLETIWIQPVESIGFKYKPKPVLRCFYLGSNLLSRTFLPQMTHLIGINIHCNVILPRLRFFRGNFSSFSVSEISFISVYRQKMIMLLSNSDFRRVLSESPSVGTFTIWRSSIWRKKTKEANHLSMSLGVGSIANFNLWSQETPPRYSNSFN